MSVQRNYFKFLFFFFVFRFLFVCLILVSSTFAERNFFFFFLFNVWRLEDERWRGMNVKLIASGDLSLILIISTSTMIYLVIGIYLIARRNFFLKIGKFDVGKYIGIITGDYL